MTEEEAVTKHCCGPEGCGKFVNDPNSLGLIRVCIASDCMAWRQPNDEFRRPSKHGYCGLVGKP